MGYKTDIDRKLFDTYQFANRDLQEYLVIVLAGFLVLESGMFLMIQPATGYETSLVDALPQSFWYLFYIVLGGGILTLIAAAVTESGYWRHGLGLIIANYALFFFLPKARGYRFYGQGRADALRHFGDIKGILATGSLPGIWYPGEHVLMAQMTMLGVPFDAIPYLTALLFTTVQIVGIGVLVRTISGQSGSLAAGLAAGAPLIYTTFHLSNHPAINSFMIVPVLLTLTELYRRSNDNEYVVLFLLIGVFIIYSHPMTTLFMVGLLLLTAVYSGVYGRLSLTNVRSLSPRLGVAFLPLLFAWLTKFGQTQQAIANVINSQNEATPAAEELQKAGSVEFSPVQLAEKFVTLYGSTTIYFAIAGVVSLVTLYWFLWRGPRYDWGLGTTHFTAGIAIAGTFLLGNLIVKGIIRANRYSLLFAAVLVALALVHSASEQRSGITVVLAILMITSAVLAAGAAYEPNKHMTYAEYDGTQYMVNHYEQGVPIHAMDTSHKMQAFVVGKDSPRYYPADINLNNNIPRNLGYFGADVTAADTFGRSYVMTKTYDTEQHTAPYFTEQQQEYLFRYGEDSLARFHNDPTANKVYTNGGFSGWSVSPDN
ncbi:hypothetical protein [Haloarcula japonica]|uniref:Transmembrane protein n=1 Tax=Haloarcula japonica (strain ATCC 49778 / DSM 6131 / JCM 7785 / NBRC 101032 / NCIMB 13157 / TR-1) TaxID=1227453 RepID=M0L0U2_HALJT|nr:hypothetical protein [Haloarcula japonica]EMA27166.1 hypothetical protein C444_20641 [Haloarcula japonica DSM 6131]